jgi:hypothetical protein
MCALIKDPGVHINWKLHFHAHEDCIFSQYVRMLDLIQTITSSLSTLVSLLTFYVTLVSSSFLPVCKNVGLNSDYNLFLFYSITLVGPKLEYTSTVWNSVLSVDTKNLEHIQQKFVGLCQNNFFTCDHITKILLSF